MVRGTWSLWSAIAVGLCILSSPALGDGLFLYEPYAKGAKSESVKVAGELEEQFYRHGVRYQDPELQAIVERVGERVVPRVADDYINWRFYLIRDPSPRAFGLADGQIYVYTGLLARLENEAQLAAVIAHEAHHVAAHDRIHQENDKKSKDVLKLALLTAISSDANEYIDYEEIARDVTDLTFFAEKEYAADAAAVALIGQARYPPAAAIDALRNMRKDPTVGLARLNQATDSTATLTERQGQLQRVVGELPQLAVDPGIIESRPVQLRRVIEMTIDDYLQRRRPEVALAFAESLIDIQPDAFLYSAKGAAHHLLGPRPTRLDAYPDWGFRIKLGPDTYEEETLEFLESEGGPERLAANLASAEESYLAAIELDDSYPRSYRGLGDLYYDQQDYRPAGRNYLQYLKLETDKMDRAFVLERLQVIKSELSKQRKEEQ